MPWLARGYGVSQFFCRFAMLYIDVCTVFCKKKKTCGHACMIYNILLLITALARRAGYTLQRIDCSLGPGRSAPTTPSTAPTPPRPASRRRRQHAGQPHIIIVSMPATVPTRPVPLYCTDHRPGPLCADVETTSLVLPYVLVLDRDPYVFVICIHMHVYIRRGAPPPSFAQGFRVYMAEHRHPRSP